MKNYSIKELLQRKDNREKHLYGAINAVGIFCAIIFVGFIAIIVSIFI